MDALDRESAAELERNSPSTPKHLHVGQPWLLQVKARLAHAGESAEMIDSEALH